MPELHFTYIKHLDRIYDLYNLEQPSVKSMWGVAPCTTAMHPNVEEIYARENLYHVIYLHINVIGYLTPDWLEDHTSSPLPHFHSNDIRAHVTGGISISLNIGPQPTLSVSHS